ncbi:MAG: hypothetical protein Q8O72_10675 [Bacteroidales bacterium]|nr:hypothetical protein [Bacteroidales bacterium]
MSNVTAYSRQSVFDIAIQEFGSIEAVFDLLVANPGLAFDSMIASGTTLKITPAILYKDVVDFYQKYALKPATGDIAGLIEYTKSDGGMITKTYNYDLANGNNTFDGVRLYNLSDNLTIQINYIAINTGVVVYIDSSLDGINYSPIPDASYTLDASLMTHQFLIIGLTTAYVRLRVENAQSGMISNMIIEV